MNPTMGFQRGRQVAKNILAGSPLPGSFQVGQTLTVAVLVGMACLCPLRTRAQDQSLTLQECLSIALEMNPMLLAAGGQVDASLARVRQAWSLPQPSLDIDSDLQPGITDFRRHGERYVGFSQTVPLPLRTYYQSRMARQESNEVLADRDLLELDITYQVTEGFYALLLAREQGRYAQQNLELAEDFVTMTEAKFEAGDVPRVEVVRARVEAAKAANDARNAENEVRLARARVNFLLAREASAPLELEGALKIPVFVYELEDLKASAREARPELKKNAFSMERESYRKKNAYASYLPDFDIGLFKHTIAGEEGTWDVTLSLELPLLFWQPAMGEISEADATLRSLREERSHLANSIALEVEEAYVGLTSAAEQIRSFEEDILTQAEEAYQMYLFSYQQGQITALDLIEARRTLNEARTTYADALYNYDIARAGMERSIGRPLQEQEDDPDPVAPAAGMGGDSDLVPGGLQQRLRLQRRNRGGASGGTGG